MTAEVINQAQGANWMLYHGDCVQVIKGIPDNSVDLGIHSPPFSSLYIYGDSEADMGNSADDEEFFKHYEFLIKELYRTTRPGRLCVVHCKDLPKFMNRDGAMGLSDFPGRIIQAFETAVNPKPTLDIEKLKAAQNVEDARALVAAYEKSLEEWKHLPNWQYHSRVTIWKDPVTERERTNNHGLLHKSFTDRAEAVRQGMPDYLVVFRKFPIEGGIEVKQHREIGDYIGTKPPQAYEMQPNKRDERENYSIALWQRYASPVWFDIQQTNVLNIEQSRSGADERHICPLQLDVIARCVDLWSMKGEVVFSPFAGIGSEGDQAIRLGRKFVGIELKKEYFEVAQKFLKKAEMEVAQPTLFDLLAEHEAAKESAPVTADVKGEAS